MNWTHTQALHFISLIKGRPTLWDDQCIDYKIRTKRLEAMEEVAQLMDISVRDAESKWINLSKQYYREKRKCRDSGFNFRSKWFAYRALDSLLSGSIRSQTINRLGAMEDDEAPALSAATFAALQEFYAEQNKRQEILDKLQAEDKLKENILFDENWQLSQFWYDEATVQALVKVAEASLGAGGRVALLSCPTLFVPMKRHLADRATVSLLEYDRRFEVHAPDFIFYDYNTPDKLPPDIEQYDLVVADPPFLSEECITKTSQTIKLLAKDKIVVCTGAVMKDHVEKLLDLRICQFQPHHRNNLANEFACYANFDLDGALR